MSRNFFDRHVAAADVVVGKVDAGIGANAKATLCLIAAVGDGDQGRHAVTADGSRRAP